MAYLHTIYSSFKFLFGKKVNKYETYYGRNYYEAPIIHLEEIFLRLNTIHTTLHTNVEISFCDLPFGSSTHHIKKAAGKRFKSISQKLAQRQYDIFTTKTDLMGCKVTSQMHVIDNYFFLGVHVFTNDQNIVIQEMNKKYGLDIYPSQSIILKDTKGNRIIIFFNFTLTIMYFEYDFYSRLMNGVQANDMMDRLERENKKHSLIRKSI